MRVRMRVEATLNEYALAALLWDAACEEAGDADDTALLLLARRPSKAALRRMVAERLRCHGMESVCCGPQNDYLDDSTEAAVLRLVGRVFFGQTA